MTLRRELALTGLFAALGAAVAMSLGVDGLRDRDRRAMLSRVADSYLTDFARDACEADPVWFLAGPRGGRPTASQRAMPDADVYLPRPGSDEMPFEVFAYDRQFEAGSSAAPRFPQDARRQLRGVDEGSAFGTYPSSTGEGVQLALLTGWSPGPCAVLLFRARPERDTTLVTMTVFVGALLMGLLIATVTVARTEWRVRRLSGAARASARGDYATMVPVSGRDEISSLGAAFNEAATGIKRRGVDARDREEALRRHVEQTSVEVTEPLADFEARLAALADDPALGDRQRSDLRRALIDTHHLQARLNNLAAVVRLRTGSAQGATQAVEATDVVAIVEHLVRSRTPLARAAGVDVSAAVPTGHVTWNADAGLLEQAFANVLDNAVLNNRPGGRVAVELKGYERDGRFTLRITDDGPGVSDDAFEALTANRRFRGDESRSGRSGRGLGLAVAREVADRFGLQLDLRRPDTGGFEVEFTVR